MTTTAQKTDQAKTAATEYRRLIGMGDTVRAAQAKRTVEDLVGYYDSDNTFRVPREVEQAMGVDPWSSPELSTWAER